MEKNTAECTFCSCGLIPTLLTWVSLPQRRGANQAHAPFLSAQRDPLSSSPALHQEETAFLQIIPAFPPPLQPLGAFLRHTHTEVIAHGGTSTLESPLMLAILKSPLMLGELRSSLLLETHHLRSPLMLRTHTLRLNVLLTLLDFETTAGYRPTLRRRREGSGSCF